MVKVYVGKHRILIYPIISYVFEIRLMKVNILHLLMLFRV